MEFVVAERITRYDSHSSAEYVSVVRSLLRQQQRALFGKSRLWDYKVGTARNGAGRLVGHANRKGPWLAPGQRSLAGPGIRDFLIRYFVNSDSTSYVCGALHA